MKNNNILLLLLCFIGFWSCKTDEINIEQNNEAIQVSVSPTQNVKKDVIRVKLERELGDRLVLTNENTDPETTNTELNAYLNSIGAKKMERVFPYAGKYEERTRKEGLHLWYDITFDEKVPITRASSDARNIKGVEIVEVIYEPQITPYKMREITSVQTRAINKFPFNDRFLKNQWHYQNFGTTPNSIAGSDINLFNAWELETGKPNVIVAIVDGGIDIKHEDLKESLHLNQAELNGTAGVDDDKNGFVDDIYGYNFLTNKATITPDEHGTHVAGTIAARNNNAIGVCGIAGGNGKLESGVRIMSCQIFEGDKSGDTPSAIKYGADNGAVISQNSWGYQYPGPSTIPPSVKAAIDYFIKYAGCDNNGNQLPDSPMKGGVVIFAAGNDAKEFSSFPAAYTETVSVASIGADFKAAYYTNTGSWVSITAPGGDAKKGNEIASTVPNNGYAYMQGTSMACPHVSGIAALVVSKYGKQGFTNTQLKNILLGATKPIDINNQNPTFKGKMGLGFIDAAKALSDNKETDIAPENITKLSVTPSIITADISWNAVIDKDDKTADAYRLYVSTNTLSESNYNTGKLYEVSGTHYSPGESVQVQIPELAVGTKYSIAVVAVDRWGKTSTPSFITTQTLFNKAPEKIELLPATPDYEAIKISWKAVTDEDDGTAKIYKLYYSTSKLDANNYLNAKMIQIEGTKFKAGDRIDYLLTGLTIGTPYYFALQGIDPWGQSTPIEFFTVSTLANTAPVIQRKDNNPVRVTSTEEYKLKLSIIDKEGHDWTYSLSGQTLGVISTKETDGISLIFKALAPIGKYSVNVMVKDKYGATSTLEVPFEVYENNPPKLLKEFSKLYIPLTKTSTINLSEYFKDPEGHTVNYEIKSLNSNIINASIKNEILTLTPSAIGNGYIEVTASDKYGAKTRSMIPIQVVKDDLVYVLYPVPVKDVLNVRLSNDVTSAKIEVRTSTGNRVMGQDVNVSNDEQRLVKMDVSKLTPGSYLLHVKANGKTFNQSFIKN